jgi:hypothetical protein
VTDEINSKDRKEIESTMNQKVLEISTYPVIVNGELSILQSDYWISPVSVAGGTLKLKDELKFAFDIVARKQE